MRRSLVSLFLSLVVACCTAGEARAASASTEASPAPPSQTAPPPPPLSSPRPVPKDQLFLRSTGAARYNPLGLIWDTQLSFRHRLYADDSAVLRENFVGLGVTPQVSAAFVRAGLLAEVQPLSVLRLWAHAELVGYFGSFGLMQSFATPTADFRDATIAARGRLPVDDPARSFATTGAQWAAGADLQLKLGPVALRDQARVVRGSYGLRAGDTVYYDQFFDVLAPNNGVFVNNDTDVLYVSDFGLVGGVRATVTQPFYGPEHFTADERARGAFDHENGPMVRAGPIVGYTFFDDPEVLLNRPTLIVIANWWLAHRFRADASQAVPFVVVGLQVTTDLLPHVAPRRSTR